jgi:SNF2 family DNA or RNA helicase
MPKLITIDKDKLNPKLTAFPYQQEAVEALWEKEYGAIFHEQGLGKTKIAIDIALHWLSTDIVDTVLIITKKLLVNNWFKECKIHCQIIPAILGLSKSVNFEIFNRPCRFVITNYETMLSENRRMTLFLKTRDVGIILDESTKIKNPDSNISLSLYEAGKLAKRKLILTGTPISNRPYDIWSQIYFLDNGKSIGKNYSEFKASYDLPKCLDDENIRLFESYLSTLWSNISAFSIRETKNSGVIELPQKIYETIECDWETIQYELYTTYKEELKAVVIRDGIPLEDNAEIILKRLLRMIQISSNPKLVDDSYSNIPGKLEVLIPLVNRIFQNGEKCIVWSSFVENVEYLGKKLKQYGVCKVHGKIKVSDRNKAVEAFIHDPEKHVFIATPASAKEGLTLTVANHAIFYDRTFSLDDYLQSQDRIHRISQEKICYIYNLVMSNSIDQWVHLLLEAKKCAAQLGQSDINLSEYRNIMKYDFNSVLKGILGLEEANDETIQEC